jgi:hypothetical protein
MISDPTSTPPLSNADATLSAVWLETREWTGGRRLLRLQLPTGALGEPVCGRFVMVRCAHDTPEARSQEWSIYLRRPLHVAGPLSISPNGDGQSVDFLMGGPEDAGYRWLASQPSDTRVNLLGPFGMPFAVPNHSRALAILAEPALVPVWLPAIHAMLDKGGRVTLLLTQTDPALLPYIPLAVELHAGSDSSTWEKQLAETTRWADLLCCALPVAAYQSLVDQIRLTRFRMEPGFAYGFVQSDLACGYGACLSCTVALPDGGMTRTCLHGPIFPLERLVT